MPIVKYYTAQVCLAQGLTVVETWLNMSRLVQNCPIFLLCFQVSIVQINKEIVQIGTNFYKIVEICLNLLKLVKTCPILSKLVKTWFFMFSGIYWAHHPLNRVKQWRIMPSKSFLKNIFLLPVWVHQDWKVSFGCQLFTK